MLEQLAWGKAKRICYAPELGLELAQIDCAAILTLSQSSFGSNTPCSIASVETWN